MVGRQRRDLKRSVKGMRKEGFRRVHELHGVDEIEAVTVGREKSWNDLRDRTGPFDIIGDVHGCASELRTLLTELGWQLELDDAGLAVGAVHPEGRTAVFVGDLVDRGPDTPGVLRLVMGMVAAGTALCVSGNHEAKLVRALRGANVKVAHGLAESLAQLAAQPEEFRDQVLTFMDGLISHYVLDDGGSGRRPCRPEGGLPRAGLGPGPVVRPVRRHHGGDRRVRAARALPVGPGVPRPGDGRLRPHPRPRGGVGQQHDLPRHRRGLRRHAHRAPLPRARAGLGACEQQWYEPARPLAATGPATERVANVLHIDDVAGTRWLETAYAGKVKIPEENAAAALEIMSRFAVDPRWLMYLPPTMAPSATSQREGFLEHPEEAFAEYAAAGVAEVVCEEKHMGSRAIAVIARDAEVAEARFGLTDGTSGVVYTRTGRSFFDDTSRALVEGLRDRGRAAVRVARHRLAGPRLRAAALVGQGAWG